MIWAGWSHMVFVIGTNDDDTLDNNLIHWEHHHHRTYNVSTHTAGCSSFRSIKLYHYHFMTYSIQNNEHLNPKQSTLTCCVRNLKCNFDNERESKRNCGSSCHTFSYERTNEQVKRNENTRLKPTHFTHTCTYVWMGVRVLCMQGTHNIQNSNLICRKLLKATDKNRNSNNNSRSNNHNRISQSDVTSRDYASLAIHFNTHTNMHTYTHHSRQNADFEYRHRKIQYTLVCSYVTRGRMKAFIVYYASFSSILLFLTHVQTLSVIKF